MVTKVVSELRFIFRLKIFFSTRDGEHTGTGFVVFAAGTNSLAMGLSTNSLALGFNVDVILGFLK